MKIWSIIIIKIAKVGFKCCQIRTNPKNIFNYFIFLQKRRNLAKSGHTAATTTERAYAQNVS